MANRIVSAGSAVLILALCTTAVAQIPNETLTVALSADAAGYAVGDTVTVTVEYAACDPGTLGTCPVAVAQADLYVDFDDSYLEFLGAAPAGTYTQTSAPSMQGAGRVAYPALQSFPSSGPGPIATFTFRAIADVCPSASNLVGFYPGGTTGTTLTAFPPPPPTLYYVANGGLTLEELGPIQIDSTGPVVTGCPADFLGLTPDNPDYTATVDWSGAVFTAVDACDGDVLASLQFEIDLDSNGSIDATQTATTYDFPGGGTHTVYAAAYDTSGNRGTCSFQVEVGGDLAVSLITDECNEPLGTLEVTVQLVNPTGEYVVGGQFYVDYDETRLSFVSADPAVLDPPQTPPYWAEIGEIVDTGAGLIDYAVNAPYGDPGINTSVPMAVFTFDILIPTDECDVSDLIVWRAHTPPTRLSDPQGQPLNPSLVALHPIDLDTTPPDITCPADFVMEPCGKMHFPQLPDPEGWAIDATNTALADQWQCAETGDLERLIFWGAWQGGLEGTIDAFNIRIYADDGGMPGATPLAEYLNVTNFGVVPSTPQVPPLMQGWIDPMAGTYIEDDHSGYNRYSIVLDTPFPQIEGNIYWIEIMAEVAVEDPQPVWGWKTSITQFLTDAVFWNGTWAYLEDPIAMESLDLAFRVTTVHGGSAELPIVSDICDPEPIVTFTDWIEPGWCPAAYTVTRTWMATDACGNFATCDQVVTVEDDIAPQIAYTIIDNNYLEVDAGCEATVTFESLVTDNACINPDNVVVDVAIVSGDATLGTPVVNKVAVSGRTIEIDGSVLVSDLQDCPVVVQVSVFAADCCGNVATDLAGLPAEDGRWVESYGAGGPPAGSMVNAASWDGSALGGQWTLNETVRDGAPILLFDTVDGSGNGERVWLTHYVGGNITLDAGLWGTSVSADVVRHSHYSHHIYVGGSLDYGQTYTETVTHAIIPTEVRAVTVTGYAAFTGEGATLPGDYPVPPAPYDQAFLYGDLTSVSIGELFVASALVTDVDPPVILYEGEPGCPPDLGEIYADPGTDPATAEITWIAPTVTDNCDVDMTWVAVEDGGNTYVEGTYAPGTHGGTFGVGLWTVTYTATDRCGNTDECSFTFEVLEENGLQVVVELESVFLGDGEELVRCITFELWDCDTLTTETVTADVLFTSTPPDTAHAMGTATIDLPPFDGVWDCCTARDHLHTLRQTDDDFGTVGALYVADFTGDPATGGDWLRGGNYNGDFWVDIVDYGVFTFQYNQTYGTPPTGDTTCEDPATPYPHADGSGDGFVGLADFTFIQVNFFEASEANCCSQPGLALEGGDGPRSEISIEELYELGMEDLAVADLNGDGWLTAEDLSLFMQGVRPGQETHGVLSNERPAKSNRIGNRR